MERNIILTVLVLSFAALAIAILLPGGRQVEQEPRLPWAITVDEAGYPTVFGVTLGKSTLADVRDSLQDPGKINLFVSPQQEYQLEAYFERIYLNGLRADFIVSLAVDETSVSAMYDRGLRVSKVGSGAQKIRLAEPDIEQLQQATIELITYIPAADLEEELIKSRFGTPSRKLKEESGITHWLYPKRGIDIALNPDGKEVFQYVIPADFDRITAPLLNSAKP